MDKKLTQQSTGANRADPAMDGPDGLPVVPPDGVGPLLRAARRERNLTGRELARRIGVSPSLISHIEGGRQRPSPRTFSAILRELETDLTHLLGSHNSATVSPGVRQPLDVLNTLATFSGRRHEGPAAVQRAEDRGVLHFPAGMRYALLLNQRDPEIDFFEVHLDPGGESDPKGEFHVHPGREFGVVLSGRIRMMVGDEEFVLNPGDSIAFDSMTPHRSENPSDDEVARLMWVCVNRPTGSTSDDEGRVRAD